MKPMKRTRRIVWPLLVAIVTMFALTLVGVTSDRAVSTSGQIDQTAAPTLQLSGNTYTLDGQHELPILAQTNPDTEMAEDFSISSIADITLFESPDRSIAYTLAIRFRAQDQPLDPEMLTQITIDTLQRGEGFMAGEAIVLAPGQIRLPWTGMAGVEPLSGAAITVQNGTEILMLVVSATGEGIDQLETAIALLSPSVT